MQSTSNRRSIRSWIAGAVCGTLLVAADHASALTVQLTQPDLDRWMYPFNATPGTRTLGSTFGAVGIPGAFDDRDAQVLLGFDTAAAGIAPGQSLSSYNVTSVTLSATLNNNPPNSFAYDPTHDPLASYTGGVDGDAGRPLELYGVGFRNGYAFFDFAGTNGSAPPGFQEDEVFGFGDPTGEGVRSVFAADVSSGSLRDVSNNVRDGFETSPFAIGTTSLAPGSDVTPGTMFEFEIDLLDPAILAYIQQGMAQGQLGFALSSFHVADQFGPVVYPAIQLSGFPGGTAPTLTIVLEDATGNPGAATPEPATLALLGLGGVVALRRRSGGHGARR